MVTANGDVREDTAVNRNQHVQLTNEAYRPIKPIRQDWCMPQAPGTSTRPSGAECSRVLRCGGTNDAASNSADRKSVV